MPNSHILSGDVVKKLCHALLVILRSLNENPKR